VIIFLAVIDIAKESRLDVLRQTAFLLDRENHRLVSEVLRLRQEVRELKGDNRQPLQLELAALSEQLAVQNRALFGQRSEKLERPQDAQAQAIAAKPEDTPQRGHGPRVQRQLPIEEVVHDLDEADKVCPKCGLPLEEMAGQFEESEEVTVVERQFKVVVHKRKKYRCRCNACVETAPLATERLIPGGRYSLEFAVEAAADKYLDHMPLQRQVRKMAREGLDIKAQTLWDQLYALSRVLRPTVEAILAEIRASALVYADETPWRVLQGKRGNERWFLWAVANDHLVYYLADPSRATEAAKKLLADYNGTLMSDGYGAYGSLARAGPQMNLDGTGGNRIKHVQCWAHVRRKFYDLREKHPEECRQVLNLIRGLYVNESRVRGNGTDGLAERALRRDRIGRKVVALIERWAKKQVTRFLPESGLVKAIGYMTNAWRGLTVFLDDPCVPLDNNHVERAIRGPVVGRKNHLGSMTGRGAEVTAQLYTLFESAKLAGIDPKVYVLRAARAALANPGTVTLPSAQN
jgi:transposase